MTFICPVANASMAPLQASIHMGLMLSVVVAGLIFLAFGVVAWRRERAAADHRAVSATAETAGSPAPTLRPWAKSGTSSESRAALR